MQKMLTVTTSRTVYPVLLGLACGTGDAVGAAKARHSVTLAYKPAAQHKSSLLNNPASAREWNNLAG